MSFWNPFKYLDRDSSAEGSTSSSSSKLANKLRGDRGNNHDGEQGEEEGIKVVVKFGKDR